MYNYFIIIIALCLIFLLIFAIKTQNDFKNEILKIQKIDVNTINKNIMSLKEKASENDHRLKKIIDDLNIDNDTLKNLLENTNSKYENIGILDNSINEIKEQVKELNKFKNNYWFNDIYLNKIVEHNNKCIYNFYEEKIKPAEIKISDLTDIVNNLLIKNTSENLTKNIDFLNDLINDLIIDCMSIDVIEHVGSWSAMVIILSKILLTQAMQNGVSEEKNTTITNIKFLNHIKDSYHKTYNEPLSKELTIEYIMFLVEKLLLIDSVCKDRNFTEFDKEEEFIISKIIGLYKHKKNNKNLTGIKHFNSIIKKFNNFKNN